MHAFSIMCNESNFFVESLKEPGKNVVFQFLLFTVCQFIPVHVGGFNEVGGC